eukprot:scaffold111470_cov31-Tisochrysis_lutea.AAC.1
MATKYKLSYEATCSNVLSGIGIGYREPFLPAVGACKSSVVGFGGAFLERLLSSALLLSYRAVYPRPRCILPLIK